MTYIVAIVVNLVHLFLSVLSFAMLIRSILSWFVEDDNRLMAFLVAVTEPIVLPFRYIFDRFNWARTIPLDVPYMVAFAVIILLSYILPTVHI